MSAHTVYLLLHMVTPAPTLSNQPDCGRPCHSAFELSCVTESQFAILTASFTWRVRGSLKHCSTFMEELTSRLPPWTIWAFFHRGESSPIINNVFQPPCVCILPILSISRLHPWASFLNSSTSYLIDFRDRFRSNYSLKMVCIAWADSVELKRSSWPVSIIDIKISKIKLSLAWRWS
jgi:hypothetical protein